MKPHAFGLPEASQRHAKPRSFEMHPLYLASSISALYGILPLRASNIALGIHR